MDLTPLIPAGRQIIERYAASGFRISGVAYAGPILVFPERTVAWVRGAPEEPITAESLAPVTEHGDIRILLIGLGQRMAGGMKLITPPLRAALRASGITIEPMDTGAACRTYSVLLAEDRRVAAALLPPV